MDKPKNRLERLIATLAIGLLAVIIIPQSAGFVTFLVWPPVGGIDPTVSGWITIHHLLQLAFTVLVMKFVFRMNLRQWGFNLNKWRESLRIFRWFVLFLSGLVHIYKVANDRFRNRTLLWLPLNRNKHSGGLWIPDPVKWTRRRSAIPGAGDDCFRKILERQSSI